MAYTTINKPSEYFNTVTWTGNGSKITTGLRPDLIWYKARDVIGYAGVVNAIRGDDYYVQTYTSDAETNYSGLLVSDSTGFTPGSVFTTNSYVAWNWLANGSGVSNTEGSIPSTVSANTTSGFSVVTYSGNSTAGATIGHGLNSVPSMVIVKSITNAESWAVYHKSVTTANNYYLYLNSTGALVTSGGDRWSVGSNSSTLFGLGNDGTTNQSGQTYVAYCFAEKKGFSKFGSYVGNGNADGTFVYTGFKPAMVIYKRSDGIEGWMIQDNRRPEYNPIGGNLFPNNANAESTDARFDFLSNGFKARSGNQNTNASTHIYMAFAEQPLVSSSGVPCTAR